MLTFTRIFFLTALLTLLTQVGGLIYLVCTLTMRRLGLFKRRRPATRSLFRGGIIAIIYLLISSLLLPPMAARGGRVPLPVFKGATVRPLTLLTPLLNRHYVDRRLSKVVQEVAAQHPNLPIAYLDANFPFYDGFPLLPHLSHDDGRKLDLAFLYREPGTGEPVNYAAPAPLGYGGFEDPQTGETDRPAECLAAGHGQYDFTRYLAPSLLQRDLTFDRERMRTLSRRSPAIRPLVSSLSSPI